MGHDATEDRASAIGVALRLMGDAGWKGLLCLSIHELFLGPESIKSEHHGRTESDVGGCRSCLLLLLMMLMAETQSLIQTVHVQKMNKIKQTNNSLISTCKTP